MIRPLLVCLLALFSGGCSLLHSPYQTTRLDLRENSYILAEKIPRLGQCYTRIINSQPTDQVCHRRNKLRYTTAPRSRSNPHELMPPYVMALFENSPDELNERAGWTDIE